MKSIRLFIFLATVVFTLSFAVSTIAADNKQAGKPQTKAQAGKQAPQVVMPVNLTPPAAPKSPDNILPNRPPQTQTQKDMLLKMSEDRKRQEKEREKRLKDAKMVQVAPAKGKTATTGKPAQNNKPTPIVNDPAPRTR